MKRAIVGLVGLALVATLTQAVAAKGPGSSLSCATFNASNFPHPTKITNPYFPLTPGDVYTYEGNVKKEPESETVTVTSNAKTINGISVVEVEDRVSEGGIPVEDTLDWFAQDKFGNVWYMGEFATQLPDETHDGSWTAGLNGAQPGLIMEASPQVGDTYCQENAPGVAQDAGQVVSVTASRTVPAGNFTNVVQTKDFSLIEPHSEYKYYASGVGLIEAIALNGGSEDVKLENVP
jgi:hypothetical protein